MLFRYHAEMLKKKFPLLNRVEIIKGVSVVVEIISDCKKARKSAEM